MKKTNDFGRDSIPLLVLKISIPFMFAQFVSRDTVIIFRHIVRDWRICAFFRAARRGG